MNNENDNPAGQPGDGHGFRVIGSNAMFTAWRLEAQGQTDIPRHDEPSLLSLQLRLTRLIAFFDLNEWPPLDGPVFVTRGGPRCWQALPSGWRERLAADGIPEDLEVLRDDAPMRIELGSKFILRRVDPLSPEHWLILEALAIKRLLAAREVNEIVAAAHALGVLQEQARAMARNG